MAQNVVIAGALFSDVPSISVPDQNNVYHSFVDPSPTTAVDSDVASGKVYFKADGTQSTGTASGGGSVFPKFTYDGNTVTCDKTFAQCLALVNAENSAASIYFDNGGETAEYGMTGMYVSASLIKYFMIFDGVPTAEVDYASSGTLTYIEPPTSVDSLSATANGTYNAPYGTVYDSVVVNVSGGATNCVCGKFTTGSTAGVTQTITVPYTGNGYPVNLAIFVAEGASNTSGSFYSTLHRYAIVYYMAVKQFASGSNAAPTYGNNNNPNYAYTAVRYKSSSTSASTSSVSNGTGIKLYSTDDASASTSGGCVKIQSKNQLSIFISDTSYGFLANTDYNYVIGYSE